MTILPHDWKVSIHALLAECDWRGNLVPRPIRRFNPRTPCGVRHFCSEYGLPMYDVSIHALLAECDLWGGHVWMTLQSFNPRTPCGVRQRKATCPHDNGLFQSTHSLRSATTIVSYSASGMLFQSTHSLRSATLSPTPYVLPLRFQSTHSLRSATSHQRQMVESQQGFNPRTPCGVRLFPFPRWGR